MTMLLDRLPTAVQTALRERAARAEEHILSPTDDHQMTAQAINARYHARQRALGMAEMSALLDALGKTPPLGVDEMRDVLLTAVELYFKGEGIVAEVAAEDDRIVLSVSRCPIFDRFQDESWHGITACGCFSRRRGWYDALGVASGDELVLNRKWDDPICQTVIHLPLPVL